ncbi:MAG: SPFH domain-containing protein [Planctomycetota bacterium]|jgi:regulator of protease activity HflC (stomatin/prohibitin superfamily)
MRVDHLAFQRATRVAAFGFLLQLVIGVVLLAFSLWTGEAGDRAFLFGGLYTLGGLLLWLALIIVFHQHKLERLEALEEDELTAAHEGAGAFFESAGDEVRVAARRLLKMHRWLMPAASLLLVAMLGLLAWWMLASLFTRNATGQWILDTAEFPLTPALGWAVAICLAFAAVSFIVSRFVAGMAKFEAWRNLRGGAGYMVGNALVLFAIATGVIFRFFGNDQVIYGVAVAIPVLMLLQALEIVVNFVLNIYRPRVPGETPRPAFDSTLLSYVAAPDSLVRSINEAVNYQFGFDVTSTWGYQLLVRSVAKLMAIAVVVLVFLSTMVIVEPHQQAVKLSMGRVVGDRVHGSGLMWKLPWPLQSASVHDVTRIRDLALTARRTRLRDVNTWVRRGQSDTDIDFEPFLVGSSRFDFQEIDAESASAVGLETPAEGDTISETQALLDAEIILQYHIRQDQNGLLNYLRFGSDAIGRRETLTERERALRNVALREVSLYLSGLTLDQVLARRREELARVMRDRVQAAFDRMSTGVEVVAVAVPTLRPTQQAAQNFEDLNVATQNYQEYLARAEGRRLQSLAYLLGDADRADEIVAEIERFNELRAGTDDESDPELSAQRTKVEQLLVESAGFAGQLISRAYAERWDKLLDARAHAARVRGQVAAFRAAPELYRQREVMRVLQQQLDEQRVFVLGIDPARVNVDVEMKERSSILAPAITQSEVSGQ